MPIPDEGKIFLLESQYASLTVCKWRLFRADFAIVDGTVAADLMAVEAAWTGYAPVVVGTLNPATIVGSRASTRPAVWPVFANGSAGPQTYWGWFLTNSAGDKLVAALNLGAVTILAGEARALTPTITDKQE